MSAILKAITAVATLASVLVRLLATSNPKKPSKPEQCKDDAPAGD